MILLDTNALLWFRLGYKSLGKEAKRVIESEWSKTAAAVSAISFWEIAVLKSKKRIAFPQDIGRWRRQLLDEGLIEISIDGEAAIHAVALEDFSADPADRIIVAVAMLKDCRLITADKNILKWNGDLQCLSARK